MSCTSPVAGTAEYQEQPLAPITQAQVEDSDPDTEGAG